MSDQGEKIVFLAREILNAEMQDVTAIQKKTHITMSFKTLCLTTLLAASGGGIVANLTHANDKPLTRYERVEIDALIFYAVKTKGMNEDNLRRAVSEKVGVTRIDDITSATFPIAQRFLQEQAQ